MRSWKLIALPAIVAMNLTFVSGARSQNTQAVDDRDKSCPDAAAERKELLALWPTPKDGTTFTRPVLREDLLQMAAQDQVARQLLVASMADDHDLPQDSPARTYTRAVDERNLTRLKHIVAQDGFPTIKMVGVEGVRSAFLLVAHAETDLGFQQSMLEVLIRRAREGEVKGGQVALLTDKILRAQGKLQRYGTQFGDDLNPEPIDDAKHVDERRRAMGMISLANYSCEIRAVSATVRASQ